LIFNIGRGFKKEIIYFKKEFIFRKKSTSRGFILS